MTKATVPRNPIADNTVKIEDLRPENPFYKKYLANKNKTETDLNNRGNLLQPHLINPLPTPNLINNLPNFENKEFVNNLNELNIEKWDKYGVSKKVKLESPNLKLDDE
jgi:DNA phosphorothioation-dependent restriction protein DptG